MTKNQAASELGKLSAIKRRELAGGDEAFRLKMQEIAKLPRKRKPRPKPRPTPKPTPTPTWNYW